MKTNALPSPSWWHQPTPQIAPLDALRITADHLESGKAVPAPAARLVAAALRQYLAGEIDITRNLGLRPPRGKQHILSRERREQRDAHIRAIYDHQAGDGRTDRARRVAALLASNEPAHEITEADVMGHLLALQREHGGDLPRSWEHILRVVNRTGQ
mgnify:FL=1